MLQRSTNADHNGLVANDGNRIQEATFRQQLREEAEIILEQQETGEFKLTKKPEDVTITQVDNEWDFIRNNDARILVERVNGTYERFNFGPDAQEAVEETATEDEAANGTTEEDASQDDPGEETV